MLVSVPAGDLGGHGDEKPAAEAGRPRSDEAAAAATSEVRCSRVDVLGRAGGVSAC